MRQQKSAAILMGLLALTLASGCTLRQRNKPSDKDNNAQPKVSMATPTPTPGANGAPQVPYSGTPGKVDPQIQIDFDEYNNPSLSDDDESEESYEPTLTGKKRFTGYTNEAGFAYTDASTDFLLPYLRTVHNESSETHSKKLSENFAKKIRDIKILNTTGGQVTIRVRYEVGDHRTATVKLSGPLKMSGRYAALSEKSTKSGSKKQSASKSWSEGVDDYSASADIVPMSPGEIPKMTPTPIASPTGTPVAQTPVENPKQKPTEPSPSKPAKKHKKHVSHSDAGMLGELRCIDLAKRGKCAHYLLRLILNTRDGEAVAEAVIRRTSATLSITPPRVETRDPRVRMLREILYNSSLRNPQGPHISSFDMQTWAVMNGRSEFQLHLQTDQNEHLYFAGPLLTAFGGEPINVLLKRNPNTSESDSGRWMSTSAGFMTSMIDSARLVKNNGRGTIKIDLIIADHQTQEPVTFGMTFTRMLPPILDLTQDSLYFNP
ncbi:MAG: hypothetical protein RJB66_2192 [Pseudomonadota bacterium]|jgi:hypothetical protein